MIVTIGNDTCLLLVKALRCSSLDRASGPRSLVLPFAEAEVERCLTLAFHLHLPVTFLVASPT